MFACVCAAGPISILKLEGNIDSLKYQDIIKKEVFPKILEFFPNGNFFWQQDNAPCHVSKSSLAFFKSNKIELLDWPSNSPDLNPVENIWSILTERLYRTKKAYNTKEKLWKNIIKEWKNIKPELCLKLVETLDNRLEMVISNRGDIINI